MKRPSTGILILLAILVIVALAYYGVLDGCKQHDGSPVTINE